MKIKINNNPLKDNSGPGQYFIYAVIAFAAIVLLDGSDGEKGVAFIAGLFFAGLGTFGVLKQRYLKKKAEKEMPQQIADAQKQRLEVNIDDIIKQIKGGTQ